MTKYHYLSRQACTMIAIASLSVTVVALFVVLAVTLSSTSNNVWSSSKAHFSMPKDLPPDDLQYALVDRFYASDDATDDDEQVYWDAKGAMEMMIADGEPVPIYAMDGLFIGSVGTYYCRYREVLDRICVPFVLLLT